MPNQIMVIQPYRVAGTWVFDDPATGLVQEPFVEGIPAIIDQMVHDIPDAAQGFRMLFSASPFPGSTAFTFQRGEYDGAWYRHHQLGEGWLCPAMLLYFSEPPPKLYAKAEAIRKP